MAGNQMVSRAELHRMLRAAAQTRSLLSMLCWVALLGVLGAVTPPLDRGIAACLWFAGCVFSPWLLGQLVCRRVAKCPVCGHSLWDCGTKNFKPRRLRVRSDVDACPACNTRFLP
jgi:hypothetical protein